MAKNDQYHPDYMKLYPGIEDRPDVLRVLKKTDRKMEYMEVEIKQEKFKVGLEEEKSNGKILVSINLGKLVTIILQNYYHFKRIITTK